MESDIERAVTLGLFVKEPRPGAVKTRLARSLGEVGAAGLYRAMVADTLTFALNAAAGHCRIFHAGAPPSQWMGPDWPAGRIPESPQSAGDLGQRLDSAFSGGPVPLLMLGSDSPDLPAAHLDAALAALAGDGEVVLADAQDGGVWCIGLRQHYAGFFDAIPWSSPETGSALRNRARVLGLKLVEVAPWYDCDLPADLDALAARLRHEPAGATMTRRWLHLYHSRPGSQSP